MSSATHREPLVILGAGPAGLSLARELKLRGHDPLLVERGPGVGSSWKAMRHGLRLGPWMSSTLPGQPVPWRRAVELAPRTDFCDYLDRYAAANHLRLRPNAEVERVTAEGDGFCLDLGETSCSARLLVNATGYFGNPFTPSIAGAEASSIPQLHAARFHSLADLEGKVAPGGRVLIVGGRLSAGELLLELHGAGYQIELSVREKLEFGRSLTLQRAVAPLYFALENLLLRRPGEHRGSSSRPMDGGPSRQLISSGKVLVNPPIDRFEGSEVVFADNRRQAYDLVLYATGYRPLLQHLEGLVSFDSESGLPPLHDFESSEQPGLFFLGLDNLRNFRSRLIRGLREDAAILAELLARRLSD